MSYCDRMLDVSILAEMYVMGKSKRFGLDVDVVHDLRREICGLLCTFHRSEDLSQAQKGIGNCWFMNALDVLHGVDDSDSEERRIGNCVAIITDLNMASYMFEELTSQEIEEAKREDNPIEEAACWRRKLAKRTANKAAHAALKA